MPTEFDPLLPRGKPAPEISGYGYSKTPNEQYQERQEQQQAESDDDAPKQVDQTTMSPLRAFFALCTIVILFAIFIALLVPGVLGSLWEGPVKNETLTFKARAEKIMSETPMIGQLTLICPPNGYM